MALRMVELHGSWESKYQVFLDGNFSLSLTSTEFDIVAKFKTRYSTTTIILQFQQQI